MQLIDGWLHSAESLLATAASVPPCPSSLKRCPPIERIPSPNFNQRPSNTELNLLILHNISLPPKQYGGGWIKDFFLNKLDPCAHPYFEKIADMKVSAHFLVERDGSIVQFVATHDRAWHAGESTFNGVSDCNNYSIGVELEGCDDEIYSEQQYLSLLHLSRCLMGYYPLISLDRICGHSDVAPNRKTDPGPAFDWPRFRQMLHENN